MKIAIVTSYPPSKVTLNEYGYHLVKNFAAKEEISSISLVTDYTSEEKVLDFKHAEKVKVKQVWRFNSYFSFFKVLWTLLKDRPDAVLFNMQFVKFGDKKAVAALGLMIPMFARFFGLSTIVLMHNLIEQVDLTRAGFSSNKWMIKFYNFVGSFLTRCLLKSNIFAVTIQKYVDTLRQKYKCKNVVLIPHGTFDLPEITDFSIPSGTKKILAFGKFGTYKRVERLIEAIELIRKNNHEDIELVIAGTDSPNTPGYLQRVKSQYAHVEGIIYTGYVEEDQVPRLFMESAIVVFPYTSTTGSSGVLHQAGSFGKAVVLPDIGDLSFLIEEEGYRGEYFNPESVSSLARSITTFLEDDHYRKRIAMLNYKAANKYSMDKIVNLYLSHYKNLGVKIPQESVVGYV